MWCFNEVNENIYDRFLRAFVGSLLVIAGLFWFSGSSSIVLYVLAASFFISAITGFCSIYKFLGISTYRKPKKGDMPRWLIIFLVCVIAVIVLAGISFKILL